MTLFLHISHPVGVVQHLSSCPCSCSMCHLNLTKMKIFFSHWSSISIPNIGLMDFFCRYCSYGFLLLSSNQKYYPLLTRNTTLPRQFPSATMIHSSLFLHIDSGPRAAAHSQHPSILFPDLSQMILLCSSGTTLSLFLHVSIYCI